MGLMCLARTQESRYDNPKREKEERGVSEYIRPVKTEKKHLFCRSLHRVGRRDRRESTGWFNMAVPVYSRAKGKSGEGRDEDRR